MKLVKSLKDYVCHVPQFTVHILPAPINLLVNIKIQLHTRLQVVLDDGLSRRSIPKPVIWAR